MHISASLMTFAGVALIASSALQAASTGPRFYGDPPDDTHPWGVHDANRPQPPVVRPGTFSSQAQPGRPPSDAIVLFDGTGFSNWESTKENQDEVQWKIEDGAMVVTKTGGIRTKQQFGDCQLHVEWAAPKAASGDGQGRGNSGVFLMGRLEIQVLDSYDSSTYADGGAGSYYGVNPPMVKPLNPPGEFQVYDIVFRRPIYQGDQVLDPGYVTVFLNGVLVQDHTVIEGSTGHRTRVKAGPFPEKGPLSLQDHNNPVRFRNIWYRELPPRSVEGGFNGPLTEAVTMAKRVEIAATIRADAATLKSASDPLPEMLRLMESLEYAKDPKAEQRVNQLAGAYVSGLEGLSSAALENRKGQILQVREAFRFMTKFGFLPRNYGPLARIEAIVKKQGWDKKRP